MTACPDRGPKEACVESAPGAELYGFRALVKKGDGGGFMPAFDPRSLPYVRARGKIAAKSSWSAALVRTATMTAGPARIELGEASTSSRTTGLGALAFLRWSKVPEIAPGEHLFELSFGSSKTCEKRVARRWLVRFGPAPEDLPELSPIETLKAHGDFAEARGQLEPKLDALDPWSRVWAAQEIARAYQMEGELEKSAEAWKRAADVSEAAGVPSQASWCLRSAAFQCWWLRCSQDAVPLLDRAEKIDRQANNEIGLARTAFYRGLFAQELGEYRRARMSMESAQRAARDLGRDDDEAKFAMPLAQLLASEGRAMEGYKLLSQLAPYYEKAATRVDRSKYQSTLGWLLLRAIDGSPRKSPADITLAKDTLTRARASIAELRDPLREANVVANLAHLAYLEGDAARARALLSEIPRLGQSAEPLLRHPDLVLLDALVLERAGDLAGAEKAFLRLEESSREENGGRDSDYTWRAKYGVGQTKRARGDRAGALASFRSAIDVLYGVGRRMVVSDSRATFFAERRRVVEDAIALLLEQGNTAEAFFVADRANAELLGALETEVRAARLAGPAAKEWSDRLARFMRDRREWDRSRKDENSLAGEAQRGFKEKRDATAKALRQSFDALYAYLDEAAPQIAPAGARSSEVAQLLAEGEALVELARVGEKWIAFFVTKQGAKHAEVDAEDPFAPFDAQLGSVRALYVSGGGLEAARSAAAYELASGKRIIEVAEVALLPHAGFLRARAARKAGGKPLVVSDPGGDLPFARNEGTAVARALGEGASSLAGDAATRDAVLAKLADVPLFHFAGHGVLEAADPWAAHLQLALEETLGLEDVLVLQPRAKLVVLSGCETGKSQRLGGDTSIGLADAFLVAGAGGVLATERAIEDKSGARFMEAFYAEGGALNPRAAFAKAARKSIAANDSGWTAYAWFGR